MKKILVPLFVVLLLAMALPTVFADDGITTDNQKVIYDFPKSMTFTVDAASAADIEKMTLVVKFPTVTRRVQAKIQPGKDAHAIIEWNLDSENSTLNGGYVPPGVSATYTWMIEDAAGNKFETKPESFTVEDNRIGWQTAENNDLAIHWYGAPKSFGQDVFDAGVDTLKIVQKQLGAEPSGKVHIWFYTNDDDFQTSMPGMNVWTGGRSFGEYRVIILHADATDEQDAIEGARHELTHQVIYDSLRSGLARQSFPQWLNEGLATYNQYNGGPLAPFLDQPLQDAIRNDTLTTLRSRDGNFPPDPHEALLSYGMSFGVVSMLEKEFGNDKMNLMFSLFQQGLPTDEVFKQAFGTDTDGLDNLYRKSVGLQEHDYSKSGIPTPRAQPTFSLSGEETLVPGGDATATPRAVSIANTPVPGAATTVPQNTTTTNSGNASTGLCGIGGGLALAMFGAYEWRKRRKPTRL